MSGGSYDYAFRHVEDFCDSLHVTTPEREAFRRHLRLIAKAMHAVEWVDSCDYVKGDETEAIMACISRSDVIDAARERLSAEIARATSVLSQESKP